MSESPVVESAGPVPPFEPALDLQMSEDGEAASGVNSTAEARRWPAIMALLVGWLLPRTTARHLAHVGLLRAFLVQVASALCFLVALLLLASWVDGKPVLRILSDIAHEYRRQPDEFMMVTAIVVGVIEAILFGLALIFLCWGARDEKLRSSLYHAVRVVWLQTPQIAVGLSLLMAALMEARGRFSNWENRAWYQRHAGELMTYLSLVLGLWVIWGITRALGSRPVKRQDDATVVCQCCGYNLGGTAPEGLCSECGEPAAKSIAAEARPGSLWQRRFHANTLGTWLSCSVQSILHPTQLGRDLQVYRPAETDDSWKMLLGHMIVSGVVPVLAALTYFSLLNGRRLYSDRMIDEVLWYTIPVGGVLTGVSVLVISFIAAGLAGIWFGWTQGRNVLLAATRVCCHLSGFVTLWVCYDAIVPLPIWCAGEYGWLRSLGDRGFTKLIVLLLIPNVVWLWIYGRLIWMAVRETRYATR